MSIDPFSPADESRVRDSPTAQLCAAGMLVDGDPSAALAYFVRAWDARRDSYDASVAAHFLARHQSTAEDQQCWNEVAVAHAEALPGDRAQPLLPSLYLNLGDSYLTAGRPADAAIAAERGTAALRHLPRDGYAAFVAEGLARLQSRLAAITVRDADI
jgi:hypothetical protein